MESGNSVLITQLAKLNRKVMTFNSHFRQPPTPVCPSLGWNGHTDIGPQGEQWSGMPKVSSMYPCQHNNHQARWDQERQDHQWSNFDVETYQRTIDQRLLDLEKRVEGCAIWLGQYMENSQGQAKETHDQEQAYRQYLNRQLIDFEERIEWLGGRMSQYLEGLLERKKVKEPQQLHKSTNSFFCLTLGGIKPVDSLSSSEFNLGDVLLGVNRQNWRRTKEEFFI